MKSLWRRKAERGGVLQRVLFTHQQIPMSSDVALQKEAPIEIRIEMSLPGGAPSKSRFLQGRTVRPEPLPWPVEAAWLQRSQAAHAHVHTAPPAEISDQ
jgi:hypothetical protein